MFGRVVCSLFFWCVCVFFLLRGCPSKRQTHPHIFLEWPSRKNTRVQYFFGGLPQKERTLKLGLVFKKRRTHPNQFCWLCCFVGAGLQKNTAESFFFLEGVSKKGHTQSILFFAGVLRQGHAPNTFLLFFLFRGGGGGSSKTRQDTKSICCFGGSSTRSTSCCFLFFLFFFFGGGVFKKEGHTPFFCWGGGGLQVKIDTPKSILLLFHFFVGGSDITQ